MMKIAIVFLASFSSLCFAQDVTCSVLLSTEIVSEYSFPVEVNTKLMFAEESGFRFFINNRGENKFEIEVFDANSETRNYAAGILATNKDEISWTYWSRDILVQSKCRLGQISYND